MRYEDISFITGLKRWLALVCWLPLLLFKLNISEMRLGVAVRSYVVAQYRFSRGAGLKFAKLGLIKKLYMRLAYAIFPLWLQTVHLNQTRKRPLCCLPWCWPHRR